MHFPIYLFCVSHQALYLFTSAKEVMFSPGFVCPSVCLFVNKITLKLWMDIQDMSEKVKGRNN